MMKKKQGLLFSLVLCLLSAPLIAELATDKKIENSISLKQLTLPIALEIAQAGITACLKENQHVSATVTDQFGQTQVMLRGTSASVVSSKHSEMKAFTAANFKKNTTELADLSDTAVGRSSGILMAAGGVLIMDGDDVYGAVGVSGSNSGASDDTCAKAGVKAFLDMLADQENDAENAIESKPSDKSLPEESK